MASVQAVSSVRVQQYAVMQLHNNTFWKANKDTYMNKYK